MKPLVLLSLFLAILGTITIWLTSWSPLAGIAFVVVVVVGFVVFMSDDYKRDL